MKKIFSILCILSITISTLTAQQFEKLGGSATDVSINPKDGKVFVVSGKNVFTNYNKKNKRWSVYSARPNNAKSVSVTKQGVVYITSTANEVFIEVNGRWIKVPGIKTNEVICERYGKHIYALDDNGKSRYLKSGKWIFDTKRNKGSIQLKQMVTLNTGEFFATNSNSEFMAWVGTWQKRSGKPREITLDHKTGEIYAVGQNRGLYKWSKKQQRWSGIPNTRKDFKSLAVYDGKIWAITLNNEIYYCDSTKKPKDYSGTYEVTFFDLGAPKRGNKYYGTMGVYLNSDTKSGRVSVPALDGKKNRVLDISKASPQIANGRGFAYNCTFPYSTKKGMTKSSLEVGRTRKFKLAGEAAKGNPEWDFQFNIKRHDGNLPGMRGVGQWEREKIKMEDVELGKMYYRYLISSFTVIGFKIEKL